MKCKKCGSENVNVMVEQVGAKTKTNNMGCFWAIGRAMLILCTCGLWLLVGRRKGKGKTQFKNKTVAVCQDCGYRWYV